MKNNIGEMIRRQRWDVNRHRFMSQEQMASQIGISVPYLSMIENGHRKPSPRILARICAVRGLSVKKFFELAGDLEPGKSLRDNPAPKGDVRENLGVHNE